MVQTYSTMLSPGTRSFVRMSPTDGYVFSTCVVQARRRRPLLPAARFANSIIVNMSGANSIIPSLDQQSKVASTEKRYSGPRARSTSLTAGGIS